MKKAVHKIATAALAVPILIGAVGLPAQAVTAPIPLPPISQMPKPLPPPTVIVDPAKRALVTSAINAVRAKNAFLGAATGPIRFGLASGGAIQHFKGGDIIWRGKAFVLKGAILAAFNRQGADRGDIGYPTSNEVGGLKAGGVVQLFATGDIYWSRTSGAHSLGLFKYTWLRNGGLNGRLGYPTSDFTWYASGSHYQRFQGGTIYQTPKREWVVFK